MSTPENSDFILVNRSGTDYKTTYGDFTKDLKIPIGEISPTDPNLNDLWIDNTQCPPKLMIWSDCNTPGGEWLEVSGEIGTGGTGEKIGSITLTGPGFVEESNKDDLEYIIAVDTSINTNDLLVTLESSDTNDHITEKVLRRSFRTSSESYVFNVSFGNTEGIRTLTASIESDKAEDSPQTDTIEVELVAAGSPLILVEDPTIAVNGAMFTVDKDSVATGGKPSYTYENEWLGTELTETTNQYKSYTVGINNKGQAVLPTSTIETVPSPVRFHYYTVDSGVTWPTLNSDFGAKGQVAWNDKEKCFVCGFIGRSSDKSIMGPRLVYPESPEKNKHVYLETPYDLDPNSTNPERYYGVKAHPTLPNTYTVATSGSPVVNRSPIVMFSIDFEAGTATYIQGLGPTRTTSIGNTNLYGRDHGEYNGVGYFLTAGAFGLNTGQLYLNDDGLFSTDQDKWKKYEFRYSDWAELCFIQDEMYVSFVRGNSSNIYKIIDGDYVRTPVYEEQFWRQIGDYVYKASRTNVERTSCIDGSTELVATYETAAPSNPTFIDSAGGDIAVVFGNGSVKFSDNSTVLGTGDSVTSNSSVLLKQTVTDQEGDFVVGSAVGTPVYDLIPFTVKTEHLWITDVSSGVDKKTDVSLYPVVFEGGHPISNYNLYTIKAVTDQGTVLFNDSYNNDRIPTSFKVNTPGDTFTVAYTATLNGVDDLEVVTDPVVITVPPPWQDFNGGVFHILGVTNTSRFINLGSINCECYSIENGSITELASGTTRLEISKTKEAVICAPTSATSIFANNSNEFVFGTITDVSRATSLKRLFYDCNNFNGVLGGNWDTSNVIDMSSMFEGTSTFDQDISNWNVSNVTNMSNMFRNATVFNSDISDWEVGNVTDMKSMFEYATTFNQNLSKWCVDKIPQPGPSSFRTNSGMPQDGTQDPVWGTCPPPPPWKGATGIYHVILQSSSDIKVTDHYKIYNLDTATEVSSITAGGEWIITGDRTSFKTSTGNWQFGDLTDTSNVTNMERMFYNSQAFNSDISNWEVGNVTNMGRMFSNAQAFNVDISEWDVSSADSMGSMFKNAYAFNQDISDWEVGNVTNMKNMFHDALAFNQDLTGWCVDKIPDASWATQFKDGSSMPQEGTQDPLWGTCPTRSVETFNYTVTVANTGYGNKYYLNGNEQQSIDAIVGDTIVFDQSDATNTSHPLRIYTDEARTTEYTTGVTVDGTTITFVVSETGTFYYQCQAHAGMGGQITVT